MSNELTTTTRELRTQYTDSQHVLTFRKIEVLFNAAKNLRDKLILESAYYPALRRFEIAKLRVEDLKFEEEVIEVVGKGNKLAQIPVGSVYPVYMNDMRMYVNFLRRKSGYVFGNNRPMSVSRVNQVFNDAAERCKLQHPNAKPKNVFDRHERTAHKVQRKINPHLLRHSQARHLKDMKFPIEFIKNYMRHTKTETTVDMYGTPDIEWMKDVGRKMMGLLDDERR